SELLGAVAKRAQHRRVLLYHHDRSRAARQSLEAERTAPGEQIEAGPPAQVLAEPVEQRFADALRRGPEVERVGEIDETAAPCAADDAHGVAPSPAHRRPRSPAFPDRRDARRRRAPDPASPPAGA